MAKLIDELRRENLATLAQEAGGTGRLAERVDKDPAQLSQWINGSINSGTGKPRGMRSDSARLIEAACGKPRGWLDLDHAGEAPAAGAAPTGSVIVTLDSPQGKGIASSPANRPGNGKNEVDIIIPQYDAGGGMGTSKLVLAEQPGLIKSWNVDHEWIRQNVRHYTSLANLCIVTGFGPSMKPLFNPGDPLLVDIGVRTVDHDAIFFFRIGEDGYIKQLQRIPDLNGGGRVLRAKSMNERYDPFDISPTNPHFEVLGKVLTIWKSEQF